MENITNTLAQEVSQVLNGVNPDESASLTKEVKQAKRIFISGTGRSGLVGKMLAMRLMHSGFSVYAVGETITPSIETDDLLLVISGSGSTATLKHFASKAKEAEARIALVTKNKDSAIAQLSDCCVRIPAATKNRLADEPTTIQPLGSQFDQSAHLLLDALVVHLLQDLDENSDASLNKKHANLE